MVVDTVVPIRNYMNVFCPVQYGAPVFAVQLVRGKRHYSTLTRSRMHGALSNGMMWVSSGGIAASPLLPCRSIHACADNAAIGPLRRLGRVLGGWPMTTKASQITKPFAGRPRQHVICLAEGVRAHCHTRDTGLSGLSPASGRNDKSCLGLLRVTATLLPCRPLIAI